MIHNWVMFFKEKDPEGLVSQRTRREKIVKIWNLICRMKMRSLTEFGNEERLLTWEGAVWEERWGWTLTAGGLQVQQGGEENEDNMPFR